MTRISPARLSEISGIFSEAIAVPTSERDGFVDGRTTDPALRREITRLLAAHDRAGGFLERLDPAEVADLLEGTVPLEEAVGRYRVLRRLGRGGMGVVYLAQDPRLDRQVALKLLPAVLGGDAGARERFAMEARAASALDHPHIGTIYEVDETTDGRPYIAMAYYEGGTLAQRVRAGPLATAEVIALGMQIADALAAAHARGLVHCDVKPANVVLAANGHAKVVDFGIARMLGATEWGRHVPGTPAYMSPEQQRGEIDPRCDVWSFGITLYEMLCGRRPWADLDPDATRAAIRRGDVPSLDACGPEVPSALAELVQRCLAADPDRRPADGGALLAELRTIERALRAEHAGGGRRIRRAGLALTVAVAALVIGKPLLDARRRAGAAPDDASVFAVMPFAAVAADTALARLGRELVVTVSASLGGTEGLRAIDPTTVLARAPEDAAVPSLERAAGVAASLGAGRVVHGVLVRDGAGVRADLGVFEARTGRGLERFVVRAPTGDVGALSDSIVLAMMRGRWGARGLTPPSVSALRTASVPALRAYLEGERAVARGRLRAAPGFFEEAFAHDTTFWFARWRQLYALNWHGEPVDSGALADVMAHRAEFPEPDRLMLEAWTAPDAVAALEARRNLTRRFPDYWPGWFVFANDLVHAGPYLGYSIADARAPLERVIELNPGFVPAWEHLFWVAMRTGDAALARRTFTHLEQVGLDTIAAKEWGLMTLEFYRYLVRLQETGGAPDPVHTAVGVRDLSGHPGSMPPERFAADLSSHGFHRAQLALSRDLIAGDAAPTIKAAHRWSEAVALAAMGQWPDAVQSVTRFAEESAHPRAALWSYGLAVAGASVGPLTPGDLRPLRVRAAASDAAKDAEGRAELAWLDGMAAAARGDRNAVTFHRAEVERSGGAAARDLARGLRTVEMALGGRRRAAADSLAALEWDLASRGWVGRFGHQHPFANGLHRRAAAAWLRESGEAAAAERLMRWHEAILPGWLFPAQEIGILLAGPK